LRQRVSSGGVGRVATSARVCAIARDGHVLGVVVDGTQGLGGNVGQGGEDRTVRGHGGCKLESGRLVKLGSVNVADVGHFSLFFLLLIWAFYLCDFCLSK
jgi:hypothetical protein